jgi:hypothetical protein
MLPYVNVQFYFDGDDGDFLPFLIDTNGQYNTAYSTDCLQAIDGRKKNCTRSPTYAN